MIEVAEKIKENMVSLKENGKIKNLYTPD